MPGRRDEAIHLRTGDAEPWIASLRSQRRRCGSAGLFEIRICRWAEPGAFRLPSPRASFVLAGATQQEHALHAKHIPEPPGRVEPQRPAVKVECDRALHLDVDLVAKLHEVLDRAEMDVWRIVPGRGQVFGPGHMTADQQLQPHLPEPKIREGHNGAMPDPQQVLKHYSRLPRR